MFSTRRYFHCVLFAVIPVMAFALGGCDQGPRSLDSGEDPGTDGHDTADTDPDVPTDGRDAPDIQGDDVPVTACVPPCTEGSCCAGACVVLGSDPDNCGTCGNACPEGQICMAGTCLACTPDCGGKTCGDDGCGGRCGICGADEACIDGNCVPCSGSCEGKDCGDDGCGHSCGTCPEGQECSAGTCIPCTANCTGKDCGDDDGCGGYCDGDCPAGGTCDDGLCVGGCVPGCSGKECGNDGCGGKCGDCTYPEECGRGGVCECSPKCIIEGWECGYDGCYSTCGDCPPDAPVCNVRNQCTGDPLIVGCSDGTREGFIDIDRFPGIAGCQAGWPTMDLRTPRTNTQCGSDIGQCPVPEDACAEGWHICMKQGWPGDVVDRITREECRSSDGSGDGIFLIASDAHPSEAPVRCDSWDPACCGMDCDVCTSSSYCDAIWSGHLTPYLANTDCYRISSSDWGVLCCRNPEVTGH
jgi:hypothetical protein